MYRIRIVPDATEELCQVPVFYRRHIEEAIEKQLGQDPARVTKNRKCLEGQAAGFEYEPPLWELRIGEGRVFYDVDEMTVVIRAIRKKPSSKRTEEIL